MNCEKCNENLQDYLDGELEGSLFAEVERHIGSCPECRSEVDRLLKMRGLLTDLRDVDVPEGERETFINALRDRLNAEGEETPKVIVKKDYRPALVVAIAAVVLLIFIVPKTPNEAPISIGPASGLNAVENAAVDVLIGGALDDHFMATSGEFMTDPATTGGQVLSVWKVIKETHSDIFEPAE